MQIVIGRTLYEPQCLKKAGRYTRKIREGQFFKDPSLEWERAHTFELYHIDGGQYLEIDCQGLGGRIISEAEALELLGGDVHGTA